MACLIDQLLGHACVFESDEAEPAALATDGVSHDLAILNAAKLLKVLQEILICQVVLKATNKDLVTYALHKSVLLLFGATTYGSRSGPIARTTALTAPTFLPIATLIAVLTSLLVSVPTPTTTLLPRPTRRGVPITPVTSPIITASF